MLRGHAPFSSTTVSHTVGPMDKGNIVSLGSAAGSYPACCVRKGNVLFIHGLATVGKNDVMSMAAALHTHTCVYTEKERESAHTNKWFLDRLLHTTLCEGLNGMHVLHSSHVMYLIELHSFLFSWIFNNYYEIEHLSFCSLFPSVLLVLKCS